MWESPQLVEFPVDDKHEFEELDKLMTSLFYELYLACNINIRCAGIQTPESGLAIYIPTISDSSKNDNSSDCSKLCVTYQHK